MRPSFKSRKPRDNNLQILTSNLKPIRSADAQPTSAPHMNQAANALAGEAIPQW
jgi:hypothetical protein